MQSDLDEGPLDGGLIPITETEMLEQGYKIEPLADLRGADLRGVNLHGADLRGVNLSWADLRGVNLRGVNLYGTNLYGTNLYGTNLSGANLHGANLRGADLSRANLHGADLSRTDLRRADLSEADLSGADLSRADLSGAKGVKDFLLIVPKIGTEFTAYKKVQRDRIVTLRIPADAKRSNATGRKCRAEFVYVVEGSGYSYYESSFFYVAGEMIRADSWDDNRWNECSHGIHFFMTRQEAEDFQW